MEEILLSLHPQYWELIKSGRKTIEIRKTKPRHMFFPFRVIVYLTGKGGVVGKFDCDEIRQTIDIHSLINGSCLTGKELCEYAAGKPLCAWHIKEGSVIEYDFPIPLERATGLTAPPQSWRYLNRDDDA